MFAPISVHGQWSGLTSFRGESLQSQRTSTCSCKITLCQRDGHTRDTESGTNNHGGANWSRENVRTLMFVFGCCCFLFWKSADEIHQALALPAVLTPSMFEL